MSRVFERFGLMVPGRYRRHMERMLVYAGDHRPAEHVLGVSVFLGIVGFFSASVMTAFFFPQSFPPVREDVVPLWSPFSLIGIAVFILIQLAFYMLIYFKMVKRTEQIEKYLPDFLQLLAANIRAGMTPFQALKFSAKDEFGDLNKEVERASTKGLGTGSFSDALMQIKESVNSKALTRSIQLFVSSMKSGARMAKILEESAKDLAETRSLKHELVTNTKMYTMFIFFTVLVGTPFLLNISIRLLGMISSMREKSVSSGGEGFGMSFLAGQIDITPDFLFNIAIAMLFVTALSAGSLMGVIKEGKIKYGFKYVPIIAFLSIVIFFAAGYGIGMLGLF